MTSRALSGQKDCVEGSILSVCLALVMRTALVPKAIAAAELAVMNVLRFIFG